VNTNKNKPTTVRWRVLLILILVSFVSYFLRSNMSIAAPAMISEFGLTEIQWGWILAAFTAGYALFQFPGGILGDKFGPRRVLTIIAILWAVFTFATALVPEAKSGSTALILGSLIAVRFLVGLSHAPIFPVMNASIVRWFPPGSWALPHGLSSTGLTLGAAAAAVLLAWMATQFGWRLSFIIIAPLGLLSAAIWWWYARDNPADHPSVNQEEVRLIIANRADFRESAGKEGLADWLRVLKNRNVLFLTLSYSSMNFVFYIVFNWFFYYLVEVREFSVMDAGFVTSSQWIAGAAGAAAGGWLCDRACRKLGLRWGCRWPVIIGMVVSAVLLILGAFHPNPTLAVTALVLCFFFNQLNEGPYWATSIAVGGKQAGASGGVMNTGANAMGFVNALLVPFFATTFGWSFAISSGAIFALIGAALMLLVRADHSLDEGQ